MAIPVPRVLVAVALCAACESQAEQDPYGRDAAARGEPVQAIYSEDLTDPWNRLFSAMFTRTVRHRRTSEFPDAGPFQALGENEFRRFPVSTRVFDRLEDGDRAAMPFYPSFIQLLDAPQAITAERLSAFRQLLTEALADSRPRSTVDRALMQMDLWAVFDRLSPMDPGMPTRSRDLDRAIASVMPLLARMIARLALTPQEMAGLPDHYAAARKTIDLPDLFSPDSGWLEIVWLDTRMHDLDAAFRQATRVFVRPSPSADDTASRLSDLRGFGSSDLSSRGDKNAARRRAEAALLQIDAVALAMQMLAIDSTAEVVPTPFFSTLQIRTFDRTGAATASEHELSRRLLRTAPHSSFRTSRDPDAAYVPSAGNDFGFASPHIGTVREPILGTLRTRCSACHGVARDLGTFSMLFTGAAPDVRVLPQPNQTRALFVSEKKKRRNDLRRLRALWSP